MTCCIFVFHCACIQVSLFSLIRILIRCGPMAFQVVGAIDQMDADDSANNEKNSSTDSKNNIKESEKPKGKRKLYVGSQAVGFCRDHVEASVLNMFSIKLVKRCRHFVIQRNVIQSVVF